MEVDPADLIGRASERAAILAALDASADHTAAVLLTGDAGIGKTAIWESVVAQRRAAGDYVFVSRATSAEARLPWVGMTDLLRTMPPTTLDSLPDVQRHALEVVALQSGTLRDASDAIDERVVGTALLSALQSATNTAPVLLAIDDLPYLDTASASAVTFALRRMEGPRPAQLLATVRDHDARLPGTTGPAERSMLGYSDRCVVARCALRPAADPPRDPARATDAAPRLRDVWRQSALRTGTRPRPGPPRDQPEGGYSTAGTSRTQRAGRCARSRPTGRSSRCRRRDCSCVAIHRNRSRRQRNRTGRRRSDGRRRRAGDGWWRTRHSSGSPTPERGRVQRPTSHAPSTVARAARRRSRRPRRAGAPRRTGGE